MSTKPYDRGYAPSDFADFESVEDRDELADLAIEDDSCESCDGAFKILGAFGLQVILRCQSCGEYAMIELESEYDDEEEEDDEDDDDW